MTALDFARVRKLVEESHALEPEARRRYLERECAGDSALLHEVESLVATAASAPQFLERPAAVEVEELARALAEPATGLRIGGYRLVRRIAAGGMGTVWEAEQADPERKVALKMLRTGFNSREAVRRFRHESQILARLQHPAIAQVYASGIQPLPGGEGLPWFAMEYVDGARTLLEHVRERALPLRERLALFVQLCAAIQHGHERGVIHRDVKPGNVLVDASGRLKVIDFGVAHLAEQSGAPQSRATRTGQVIGTLQYMSPEQVSGTSDGVDTRSDVYALGAVLYELLTFQPPFALEQLPLPEAARVLLERPPPRPSSRASGVDADLDAVVLKALEKERERRYASAAALAADVERSARGEPVEARPPSVAHYLRSFARRHKALVASTAIAALALVAATAVSVVFAWRAWRAEAGAVEQRDAARFHAYAANVAAAYGALRNHDVLTARARLDACPEDLRGFEWRVIAGRLDRSRWERVFDEPGVASLRWLPDGRRIALATNTGRIELRDAVTGRIQESRFAIARSTTYLAVDPAGRRIAVVTGSGWVQIFTSDPFEEIGGWRAHEEPILAATFGCDERVLVTLSSRGVIRLWDVDSGALLGDLSVSVSGLEMLLDVDLEHRRAALGTSVAGEALIVDLDTGVILQRLRGHGGYLSAVVFTHDGERLVTASHDHLLRVWDVESGKLRTLLQGHTDLVMDAEVGPDGRTLASSGWDRTIRLWDLERGTLTATLLGHANSVYRVAFSPDGRALASSDDGLHLRRWSIDPADTDVRLVRGKWLWTLRFFPGGDALVAVHGGFAHRYRASDLAETANYPVASNVEWRGLAIDPDGSRVALGNAKGEVQLWTPDGEPTGVRFQADDSGIINLDWSPGGERIAAGTFDGQVRIFDTRGILVGQLGLDPKGPAAIAYSPGGERLAVAGQRGELALCDPETGAFLRRAPDLGVGVHQLAWSPDGRRLALALADGRILACSSAEFSPEPEFIGHEASVEDLAFSPDGTRLASCGLDRSVRLWELDHGREVAVFGEHTYVVVALAFSPDGSLLATASADSTLRMHRASRPTASEADAGRADDELIAAWLAVRREDSPRLALQRAHARATSRLAVSPADLLASRVLAAADLRLGATGAALERVTELARARPEDPQLRALLGVTLSAAGRASEARAELEWLDAIDPAADPGTAAGFSALRGELRERLGAR